MQKLLVTGGAGFIGSNFVRRTLEKDSDIEIIVLDKLGYAGNRDNLKGLDKKRLEFIKGDVADAKITGKLVSQVDAVVHFAAESHVDNSLEGPWPFIESNVVGTYQILEAVRKHNKRLHHISTDEVFGDIALDDKESFFDEATAYRPSSPYAASKASADHLVRAWIRSFGLRATISNCSNNYGPYQHVEKFIPRAITNILDGEKPKLYGKGLNVRDWIHVDDHNDAVMAILKHGKLGETYMIGAHGESSNKEVLELILDLLGKPTGWYQLVSDRPGHDLRYAIDPTKIEKQLGWKAKIDLKTGLAQTIQWYKDNRDWWEADKTATEKRYKVMGR